MDFVFAFIIVLFSTMYCLSLFLDYDNLSGAVTLLLIGTIILVGIYTSYIYVF